MEEEEEEGEQSRGEAAKVELLHCLQGRSVGQLAEG